MAITLGYDKVLGLSDDEFARGWRRESPRATNGDVIMEGFNDQDFEDREINEWWSHTYYDLALCVRRAPMPDSTSDCGLAWRISVAPCSTMSHRQPPYLLVLRVLVLFGLEKRAWRRIGIPGLWRYSPNDGNALRIAENAFETLLPWRER